MFHKPAQPLANISPCGRPIPIGSKLPHLGDVARLPSGMLRFFFLLVRHGSGFRELNFQTNFIILYGDGKSI